MVLFLRLVFRVGLISFSIFWWGLPNNGGLAELRLLGGGGGWPRFFRVGLTPWRTLWLKITKAHCRPIKYYLEYLYFAKSHTQNNFPKKLSQPTKMFNTPYFFWGRAASRVLLTKYAQKFLRIQTNLNK